MLVCDDESGERSCKWDTLCQSEDDEDDANLRTKHLTLIDRGYKVFANADTVILEHDYSTCYTDDGVH